jgi:hypothetical protein
MWRLFFSSQTRNSNLGNCCNCCNPANEKLYFGDCQLIKWSLVYVSEWIVRLRWWISHQDGIEASKVVSSQGEEKKAAKDLENTVEES